MSKSDLYTWIKIADSISDLSFSEDGFSTVQVNDKTICIAMFNGKLLACQDKCPHAGGTLSEGYLDSLGNIVCPNHHYKFSLTTGRNVTGEGYFLKIYVIEERDKGVFIGMIM